MALHDLAGMTTLTTGTGTLTLVDAIPGCNTFDDAGVANGETVHYALTTYDLVTRRPTHRETGSGVYTTSSKTLTRATVNASTNGGLKIDLTGLTDVTILPFASEIGGASPGGSLSWAVYYGNASQNITNTSTDILDLDSMWVDDDSLFSIASDTLTLQENGDYEVSVEVAVNLTTMNGRVEIDILGTGTGFYNDFVQKGYTTAMGIITDIVVVGPVPFPGAVAGDTLQVQAINNLGGTASFQLNNIIIKKIK